MIVEDGADLRWWHTYIFSGNSWQLDSTRHAVLDDDEAEEFGDEIDGNFVPDFVDDMNEVVEGALHS